MSFWSLDYRIGQLRNYYLVIIYEDGSLEKSSLVYLFATAFPSTKSAHTTNRSRVVPTG